MKKFIKFMILSVCILFMTSCSDKKSNSNKITGNTNSVDKVINNQINNENSKMDLNQSKNISADKTGEDTINDTEDTFKTDGKVDYDLTQMSSDMVYATVYQMMVTPKEYERKTFRISGNFYASYYKDTNKYYYYCVIQDATACCAQGIEFVWDNGTHIYPDEYPEDNAQIVVEGTFETYREAGDKNLYCRLSNATLH